MKAKKLLNVLLLLTIVTLLHAAAPPMRWSVREQLINQISTGKQFTIKGKFVIRATAGQIQGDHITVTVTGRMKGEELKPMKFQMRHTQRGVLALRSGKSLACTTIRLRGHELLSFR